jgi:hypothetical protein
VAGQWLCVSEASALLCGWATGITHSLMWAFTRSTTVPSHGHCPAETQPASLAGAGIVEAKCSWRQSHACRSKLVACVCGWDTRGSSTLWPVWKQPLSNLLTCIFNKVLGKFNSSKTLYPVTWHVIVGALKDTRNQWFLFHVVFTVHHDNKSKV